MKRARIAKITHKCSKCRGLIHPGHVYHEDNRREDGGGRGRFFQIRTCSQCHNASVPLPPVHGCKTKAEAFWAWFSSQGRVPKGPGYSLDPFIKEWEAGLSAKPWVTSHDPTPRGGTR